MKVFVFSMIEKDVEKKKEENGSIRHLGIVHFAFEIVDDIKDPSPFFTVLDFRSVIDIKLRGKKCRNK